MAFTIANKIDVGAAFMLEKKVEKMHGEKLSICKISQITEKNHMTKQSLKFQTMPAEKQFHPVREKNTAATNNKNIITIQDSACVSRARMN